MIGPGFIDDIDNDLCGDFFDHIDDLLDFPMEDGEGEGGRGGVCDAFQGGCWPPVTDTFASSTNASLSGKNGYTTTPELPTELSIPYEDIAQLEWLSNFVEDSFSAGNIIVENDSSSFVGNIISSNDNKKDKNSSNNDNDDEKDKHSHRFQTSSPVSVLDSSSSCSDGNGIGSGSGGFMRTMPLSPVTFVPGRARSKRRRPASFNPRTLISLISPTSSSVTEDPNTFSTSESASELDDYAGSHTVKKIYYKSIALASVEADQQQQQKKKKKKKKKLPPPPSSPAYSGSAGGTDQPLAVRKCLHCEITKTPQWRAGPLGPKTLCNACGVRYKSGRLFPEYRPAASPTFVASVHSNSHKKVLEMRSTAAPKSSFLPAATAATPELVPNSNPLLDYI